MKLLSIQIRFPPLVLAERETGEVDDEREAGDAGYLLLAARAAAPRLEGQHSRQATQVSIKILNEVLISQVKIEVLKGSLLSHVIARLPNKRSNFSRNYWINKKTIKGLIS